MPFAPQVFASAAGALSVSSTATIVASSGGNSYGGSGELAIAPKSGFTNFAVNGQLVDLAGRLVCVPEAMAQAPLTVQGGLQFDVTGALVVVEEALATAPLSVTNGLVFDANGALVVNEGMPSLSLDFLAGTLDPRITFSRASNATMFDSQGRLVWAPSNMLLWSNTLSAVNWTKVGDTIVVGQLDPLGGLTATLLVANAIGSANSIGQSRAYTAGVYTSSVYVKSGGRRYCQILWSGTLNTVDYANFDLVTGVITAGTYPSGASITSIGNGWYRISITSILAANAGGVNYLYQIDTGTALRGVGSTGDGVNGVYAWCFQVENAGADSPKAYNETTSAAYYGPRFDYNPATLAPLGLLVEETRTNLVLHSHAITNASWTKTDVTFGADGLAPSGLTEANLLVNGSAGTAGVSAAASFTVSSGAVVAFSCFVKAAPSSSANFLQLTIWDNATNTNGVRAWLNLSTGTVTSAVVGAGTNNSVSVRDIGSGWWQVTLCGACGAITAYNARFRLVGSDGSNAPSNNVQCYVWGAQFEVGNIPTSLIPTYGVAATRAAEVATMSTAGWLNSAEGTFFSENWLAAGGVTGVSRAAAVVSDGTSVNRLAFYPNASEHLQGLVTLANVSSFSGVIAAVQPKGQFVKSSMAWTSAGISQLSQSGALATAGLVATVPTGLTTLSVGGLISGGPLNGWVKSLKYWPNCKTNAQLQALTA